MSEETPESIAATGGHLLGISSGWEQAAEWLLEQASKSFKTGVDNEARLLRGFAEFALRTSEEKRRVYDVYKDKEG